MPDDIRKKGRGLSENAKTALLTVIASLLFFALIIGVYVKAGSDAYKKHNPFDSYTLQALAWRRGETKLDKNYPHLELAIINREWLDTHDKNDYMAYRETFGDVNAPIEHVEGNEYYVSFPPVPSVPMLIMSFFTGGNTPDNLFSILYVVGSFALAILIGRRLGYGCIASLCGGILSCAASGAFFLAANKYAGGPWFAAQTMAMLFTLAAFYSMLGKHRIGMYMAFAFLALAVGCRPFQIVYFLLLAYAAAKKNDFKVLRTWKYYIAPAVIGGTYMWYNYIRFGSVLEFGHNYLPEFMRTPYSKFALENIAGNLKAYFSTFPWYKDGKLDFSHYGFAFYVSNVIFLLCGFALLMGFTYLIIRLVMRGKEQAGGNGVAMTIPELDGGKRGRTKAFLMSTNIVETVILVITSSVVLFLLLMHRTAGGWQFGMRYTVDIVPAALLMLGYCLRPFFARKNAEGSGESATDRPAEYGGFISGVRGAVILLTVQLIIFGLWLNIYGSLIMFK
ncbi:MAG: hypothetical protein J5950_05880 [Clostridia bacterium]|nr:hypothetical protein [Clostridia bacterium]